MPVWIVIALVLAAAVLASAVAAVAVRRHDRKKLEYMLDAFEDGEYNFRFASRSRFNRTLNRIKLIMDRQRQHGEQESWTKLIRVLTHEIMNTVSPIASLSDMLGRYAGSGEPGHEAEIKAGLETISSSSRDLMKFVESYRELAGVARPLRRGLLVGELVHKVIELTAEQFKACVVRKEGRSRLVSAHPFLHCRIILRNVGWVGKNHVEGGIGKRDVLHVCLKDHKRLRTQSVPVFSANRNGQGRFFQKIACNPRPFQGKAYANAARSCAKVSNEKAFPFPCKL